MFDKELIAYMLTSTTYGTWLHGDERGSIDRHGLRRSTRFLEPDPTLEGHRRKLMKFPAYTMDQVARALVDRAMRDYCEFKGWKLIALNVRTNHFHAMFPNFEKAKKVLGALKARATRVLREQGVVAPDQPVWTKGGGVTLIYDNDGLAAAVDYVRNRQ